MILVFPKMEPPGGGRGEAPANVRLNLIRLHFYTIELEHPSRIESMSLAVQLNPLGLLRCRAEQLYSFLPHDAAPVAEDERQTAVLERRHGE